ncbi:sensory box sensor histidine kinase/response regulator VieS [Shewanella sairae]|uniref:histidine kinase n=1 Tax=Shewanella sairae TaxID=190310 RepID=A0ABQ4PEH8_9GAMM|nr:ATP-binding protein [Shewanella sairae]MCL1130114.1 ATP-binding protein [Shewanella sairae]GIU45953.1 sensory box sensor histidine kinase/response regulator VieS [Shewanella sairae]
MTRIVIFLLLVTSLFCSAFSYAIELKPEAKAYLKKKEAIVVAMPSTGLRAHWNTHSPGALGIYTDYIRTLVQELGIAVQFKGYECLDELQQAVASGEADLSLGFMPTTEREKSLLFSVPVFENYQLNWLRNSSYRNTPASDMNWVCVEGSFSCEATAQNGFRTLTKVKTLDSLIHYLSTGKADGAIIHFGTVHHYYQTVAVGDWLGDIVFNENSQPMLSSFITAKNNPILMDILNQYQQEMHNNKVIKPFKFKNLSMLHNEQAIESIYQQYNRQTIRYSIENDLYPLSYISKSNGEISGYIHDIIKILARKSGLNFEYVAPMGQSIDDMLNQGVIDLIPGGLMSVNETSTKFLTTHPFYTINWSFIRTTKTYQQQKIAVLDRSGNLPEQGIFKFIDKPIIYTDFALLKKDIESGVVTHAYIPKSIAEDYLYYGSETKFELVNSPKKQLISLMGIKLNLSSETLRDMLDAAIAVTTAKEISLAVKSHQVIHTKYGYDKKQTKNTVVFLLVLLILAGAASILWSKKLKGYLREARASGKKSHDQMQWLTSVLNSFPGMVLISDDKGSPLLSNKAYSECFKTCINGQCKESQDTCAFLNVINTVATDINNDAVYVANDKCTIAGKYYRVSRDVVNHDDGNQYHITVFTDFTELKQRKEELILSKQQAVDALKTRESFLAVISHELRTPLAAMIGLMELLNPELKSAKNKELVSNALASADRLKGLVNDILDFSKMEADQLQLDLHQSNLFIELGSTLRLLEASLDKKEVNFIINWQPTKLCNAELDWSRLSQIVNNLVNNSIKFTQKGTITVSVSNTQETLTLTVEDTGCGMTDEQQQKLFQPFVQADASINRKYGGSGLGMSIVQHLVELMGGALKVSSKLNQGTKVRLSLPANFTTIKQNLVTSCYTQKATTQDWLVEWGIIPAKVKNDAVVSLCTLDTDGNTYPDLLLRQVAIMPVKSNTSPLLKHAKYSGTVLVADDDPINCFLFQKQLKKLGLEVITVHDGMEALLYLAANKNDISLLITDFHMPNLNGYELVTQLRAKAEFASFPIIGCTAEDSRLVVEKAAKVGMTEVMYKPYSFQLLGEVISRYCPEQSPDSTLDRLDWLIEYTDEEQLELSAIVRDSLLVDKAQLVDKTLPITALAHRIKGAATAIGLTQLATIASDCEAAAEHELPEATARLSAEIDIIVSTINNWLAKQYQ